MFVVDTDNKKITLHKGDTGTAPFRFTGFTLEGNVRVLWTIKNRRGELIMERIYTPVDNEFSVEFSNSDTDSLPAGTYYYDARVVIDPVFDDQGHIVDGEYVNTPASPLQIEILDTVGEV
jgi:hypothetical protein